MNTENITASSNETHGNLSSSSGSGEQGLPEAFAPTVAVPASNTPSPQPFVASPSAIPQDDELEKMIAQRVSGVKQQIAHHQVEILKKTASLNKLWSEPDYKLSVLTILKEFGETTIGQIGQVIGNTKALNEARKQLLAEGLIVETSEGSRKLLQLVTRDQDA